MTLYAPLAQETAERVMRPATDLMDVFGFEWWVSPHDLPNFTLMIDCPEVWHQRGPTRIELSTFFALYDAGKIENAREIAQTGLPEYLR